MKFPKLKSKGYEMKKLMFLSPLISDHLKFHRIMTIKGYHFIKNNYVIKITKGLHKKLRE